jgi:uncharacterized membrane protein (DUF2068 family)
MISGPIVRYVLKAALFDRIVISFLILIAVALSLSVFLGSAAATETDLFSLVFAAGGLRLTSVLGLVLFIVFHMRRSFETKDVDYLLTRPISRVSFIVSHAIAFSLLATLFSLLMTVAVFVMGGHAATEGFALWSTSMWVELIIIANAALFFSMVLPNAASGVLSVFSLYLLARLMGQILGIVDTGGLDLPGFQVMSMIMQFVSMIVPRLDLMGQTSWLIYGPGEDSVGYLVIALQGLVYTALLVSASCVDLVRRQF